MMVGPAHLPSQAPRSAGCDSPQLAAIDRRPARA